MIIIVDIYFTLEKEMANHCSILAWKIPWMEEPGRLQSLGSQSDMTKRLHFTSLTLLPPATVRLLAFMAFYHGCETADFQDYHWSRERGIEIGQVKRPQISVFLTRLSSFLE